jgi:hypothetical protein
MPTGLRGLHATTRHRGLNEPCRAGRSPANRVHQRCLHHPGRRGRRLGAQSRHPHNCGATSTAAGAPAIVLATAAGFLTRHPADVTAILQGDIQATVQLTTAPATALPGARAELLALLRHPLTRHATAALARYHATTSPGTGVASAFLDLTPVNTLLKASGLPSAS